MNKKYYYPISSTSLASIFGQACILPASLYINRIPDIQSKFENFILLTDRFGVLGSDCCIEIMLTREEEESLIDIKESFFFYEKAIPVSRIKKIYFEKEVQALRTISNITLSTAFIPKHIIANGNHTFDHVNINNIVIPNELVDSINVVKTSYDTYNRILGALALMKTAHKDGCNVSPFYIDTLSKFNKLIEIQKKSVFEINTKFHSIIDNPLPLLKQIIDSNILNEIALKEKQQILKSKITNVIDPSNLDGITYICYVLYNYGVGEESRRRKIDELILNNFTGLKRAKEEACAFYYGYNRGYAVFNNQYRGENKTEIVKFQLNSLLDYYTIESRFEYSFDKNSKENYVSLNDSYIGLGDNKYYNSSQKVYAIDDGIVTKLDGNNIYVEHDNGVIAKYHNINNPFVFKYDRIKEYQVIALFNDYIELYFYKDGNIINYEEIYSKNI